MVYSGELVELALVDREGRDKLVIPASLLINARIFCESKESIVTKLTQLTQLPHGQPREESIVELESLAGELADFSFESGAEQEAGILEWVPPSLARSLTEDSTSQRKGIKSSAALAAALQRGLAICHMRDQWMVRRAGTGGR